MRQFSFLSTSVVLIFALFMSCNTTKSSGTFPNGDKLIDQGYSTQLERNRTTAISQQTISDRDHGMTMKDIFSRVAGVTVYGEGSNLRLQVRGNKSFHSDESPLYVLDGRIMGSGFSTVSFLDPLMIDRVSVLKDAAAASEYGMRGANGVILISLKKN